MKPNTNTQCGVCEPRYFERNNYFYGKQFTVRDLLQEQHYFNEKRRLINRMVLGWGVVCGLAVCWRPEDPFKFVVHPGLALDCCGREIIVCEEQALVFDPHKTPDDAARAAQSTPSPPKKFALCLEYAECKTEPVALPPLGCEKQERTEYNRIRDGFKLQIKDWDEVCHQHPDGCVNCLDRFKHDLATGEQL